MAKYSYEQRLEVVMGVIRENVSFKEATHIIGACKGDAQKWVRLYEIHGIEGLLMKSGSYDGQFKVTVVEYMHTSGLSARETAAKFGIPSHSTISVWERIFYEQGREALLEEKKRGRKRKVIEDVKDSDSKTPKPDLKIEEDLIAENRRLKMENAYLKKLQALVHQRIQQGNQKK
jgi:transposase